MTVMQHEREAVGGFSKEVVEDKGDVLSSLRHLHRTLQECHWRVQSVDHALCAQGNKSLDDLQNHDGKDHSFQFPVGTDCSLQTQHEKSPELQDETVKECILKNEAEKNYSLQNEAGKKQSFENQFRENNEQKKDNSEDHNHQNEMKEELRPENLLGQDTYYKELLQGKKSQNIRNEDESFSLQDEGIDSLNLFSDSKENFPTQSTKDIDLQKAMKDYTVVPNSIPDHHIHMQIEKETSLLTNTQSTCDLDYTVSPHEQQSEGFIRQVVMDGDITVDHTGSVNALVELQPNFRDNVGKTCAEPYTTTDDMHHQPLEQHLKCSDNIAKEVNSEILSQLCEVRCRADHKEKRSHNEILHERKIDLFENQKTSDVTFKYQKKDKATDGKRRLGKVSLVDTFPDVIQKMDSIWEALEKLRSHFLALHSSIEDSSSHCLYQEHDKSLDNSDFTISKVNKPTMPSDMVEEHHARCEDEAGMATSEVTQSCQSFCTQSSHKETLSRNISQSACHSLSRSCTRACTFQHPANEAAASDSTAYRGILFQGWREGCLCIGLVLFLLLLLLFLASCLLLMLPIVSVSVRNTGGVPAF